MEQPNQFGRFSQNGQRPDPDELMARLRQMQEQAEETLRKYEEFREQAGELTSEGVSDDGSVRVVMNEQGEVTEVNIANGAMRHGGNLGRMIMSAIQRAQAEHSMQMAELASHMMSGDMDIMNMVNESIPEEIRDSVNRHRGGGR